MYVNSYHPIDQRDGGADDDDDDVQGPDFTRPKHKRTNTGFGPGEIKSVESSIPEAQRDAWKKHVRRALNGIIERTDTDFAQVG